MDFDVYSRQMVELVRPPMVPHAFISIRTPGDPNVVKLPINHHTKGVLHLKFHDLDVVPQEALDRGYLDGVNPAELFTDEMAQQVVQFMQPLKDQIDLLVAHCDAGWSRSPGVAAAIARTFYGLDDSHFFKRYTPNRRVYRNILNAYLDLIGSPEPVQQP